MFKPRFFAAVALAFALPAQAQTVDLAVDGSWSEFVVDDFSAESGIDPLSWIADDGSAIAFEFTLSAPALLKVVDAGFSGDRFQVFDNGVALGYTSVGINNYVDGDTPTVIDFNAAWSQTDFSRGEFLLGAGSHNITGLLAVSALDADDQPFNATLGGVALTAVPLPGAAWLMLSGSGLLAAAARRRSA
ncbi:hypothetical protein BJL95_12145 [Methylomonas sp. LWB]|uniref:hypothetical protein n=1 Tax=Methylomonas sp. LWB TaxID=1905845 RepID=UPI0008D9A9B7|nr:hypothetical protein [Methylomonas sp. LWB]OHX34826.1 hypothetical protein BJL95_12145 [Methylomonas sp. LWB]